MLGDLRSELSAYNARLRELQSAMLLALTYLATVGPVWLVLRLTGRRPLGHRGPGWHRGRPRPDIESMRSPF